MKYIPVTIAAEFFTYPEFASMPSDISFDNDDQSCPCSGRFVCENGFEVLIGRFRIHVSSPSKLSRKEIEEFKKDFTDWYKRKYL